MSSPFIRENYIFPDLNAEEYDVKLRQYLNVLARAVNSKDSGLYTETEDITGQQFLPVFGTDKSSSATFRDVFRTVIDFGALPNNTIKSVAHGIDITNTYSGVKIYGGATEPGVSLIPLPFSDVGALTNNISLEITATNVTIETGTNRSNYTRTFVVVEYIKVV